MKKKNMDQINDPHGRIPIILRVLRVHQGGISLNKLSKETGIHKETLDPFLEFLSDQGLIILDKSSPLKWKIRLGEIVEAENTVINLVKGHFESYLALLPKSTKVVQVESVVHFLQTLATMQMFVYLNYLNTNTTLKIAQHIIANQLEKLRKVLMKELFSTTNTKTSQKYASRINQEVSIVAGLFAKKADTALESMAYRTKYRTIEDILFDANRTVTNQSFIQEMINI